MKTSQSPDSRSANLQDCLTLADFGNSICRLWNLSDNTGDIKGIACEMQIGKIHVRISEDIELGHKVMMNMSGKWWAESINGFAYYYFAHVTLWSRSADIGGWLQKEE